MRSNPQDFFAWLVQNEAMWHTFFAWKFPSHDESLHGHHGTKVLMQQSVHVRKEGGSLCYYFHGLWLWQPPLFLLLPRPGECAKWRPLRQWPSAAQLLQRMAIRRCLASVVSFSAAISACAWFDPGFFSSKNSQFLTGNSSCYVQNPCLMIGSLYMFI